ncbi:MULTISPECIES: efflux RND transporter periplasmic adaptor subunit [Methylobacterium]|jgi:cobalt-zinc-cadmium efflux system membrane fusion protein|uniref:RND transporter n=2 Tax=Methylobacterium TaxID=407 RepID=A0A2U8VTD9_9HYPH|nr:MULTISPECIES: efflux RND transporter periplasmic adaptor subunit [Methylobacterium]AWN36630.1 RND transporter [Methylobacterium radiodurans]GJD55025.1 Multidrug resistance protein MdtA [Methylobacterium dankookense]VUF12023.1 Multidrug resistance protein MdtA [Methylobacterium dankookense]
MSTRFAAALHAVALLAAVLAGPALAHEGHDHGTAPPPVSKTIAPRGEALSDAFELVAIPRDGTLTLFLDRFRTNEPVTGATIEVETPEGPKTAAATDEGGYALPAPWLAKPGRHDLVATVTAGDAVDVLTVAVTVPDPASQATAAPAKPAPAQAALSRASEFARGLRERLTAKDPILVAAVAVAFLLGVLVTALARGRRGAPAVALLAIGITLVLGTAAFAHGDEDHGAPVQGAALIEPRAPGSSDLAQRLPDGSVFVPKPTQRLLVLRTTMTEQGSFHRSVELPGRIIPDPNASGVVQSSVGGRLSPPPSGLFPRLGTKVRKGDVLATVTPPVQAVDVSDMRQRQGELDQQIAIVERRVERYRKLATTGAVATTQLDDAVAELNGLHDRRAALDKIRQQPETLVAPVDGVVAQATAVAGQMAAPGAMVFQIVDPNRLWVEALSFDALTAAQNATARLADGRSLKLAYQGTGLADRNQAIPVQFAVSGDASGLRVGQFVTVLAGTDTEQSGLALPRAAVVRTGNGQDVVYEHTTAERFEARPVRVEPLDGGRVLVAEGIGPGKRVVTQGAELLDQVR